MDYRPHRPKVLLALVVMIAAVLVGCSGKSAPVTDITSTSATLHSLVHCGNDSDSSDNNCYMHYGYKTDPSGTWQYTAWVNSACWNTTTANTPHGCNVSSPHDKDVPTPITGLTPNTTYDVEVCGLPSQSSPPTAPNDACAGSDGNVINGDITSNYTQFTTAAAPSSANKFVSTTGNDANACTQAAPCQSFNRAYNVASPGDTVEVAGGTYDTPWTNAGGQLMHGEQIAYQSAKDAATSDVTFKPAAGATVNVNGNIRVLSSHVSFQDMHLQLGDAEAQAYDPYGAAVNNNIGFITFRNITARNFEIQGTHDVSVLGGSYGPSSACGSAQPGLPQYGGGTNALRTMPTAGDPKNITISGVTIHNIMSYDLVNCHTEGLSIFSCSTNCTVTGSKFYGNDVYDVLIQSNSGSGPIGSTTVTNNWFGASTNSAGTGSGSASIDYDSIGPDSIFANNSLNMSWQPDGRGENLNPTNFKVWGNIGSMPYSGYCPAAQSAAGDFKHNVWQNSSCGSTDTNLNGAALPYVSATNDSTQDYTLTGGVAQDYVPLAEQLVSTDIAGNVRPDDGEAAIDAGASEIK